MEIDLDEVEVGIAVNVEILREVLKRLSVNGRTFWIACEPAYAYENRYLTLGFGCCGCTDRLNTLLYRVPILNSERPLNGPDKLVVLIDPTTVIAEQAGLYRDGEVIELDSLSDLEDFILPIRRALVPILAEYTGASLNTIQR